MLHTCFWAAGERSSQVTASRQTTASLVSGPDVIAVLFRGTSFSRDVGADQLPVWSRGHRQVVDRQLPLNDCPFGLNRNNVAPQKSGQRIPAIVESAGRRSAWIPGNPRRLP